MFLKDQKSTQEKDTPSESHIQLGHARNTFESTWGPFKVHLKKYNSCIIFLLTFSFNNDGGPSFKKVHHHSFFFNFLTMFELNGLFFRASRDLILFAQHDLLGLYGATAQYVKMCFFCLYRNMDYFGAL